MSNFEEIIKQRRLERMRNQQQEDTLLQMNRSLYPSAQAEDYRLRQFDVRRNVRDDPASYFDSRLGRNESDLSPSSLLQLHRSRNMRIDSSIGGLTADEQIRALLVQKRKESLDQEQALTRAIELHSRKRAPNEESKSASSNRASSSTLRSASGGKKEQDTARLPLERELLTIEDEIRLAEQHILELKRQLLLEEQALIKLLKRRASLGVGYLTGSLDQDPRRFMDDHRRLLLQGDRGLGGERFGASSYLAEALSRRRFLDGDDNESGSRKRFKADRAHIDARMSHGTALGGYTGMEEQPCEDAGLSSVLDKINKKKKTASSHTKARGKTSQGNDGSGSPASGASVASDVVVPVEERIPVTTNAETGGVSLAIQSDEGLVSSYQILVRTSLEFFTAKDDDVAFGTQGRKKDIFPGQVGVRCKFCANRQAHWRGRGSVYFPGKLAGVYQAAQNMAVTHLLKYCNDIPDDLKKTLADERQNQRILDRKGGGKKYWIDSCRKMGLRERDDQTGLFWA